MATINGSNGNDSLDGTSGDDSIFGFDGDDTLYGLGGIDLIVTGDGLDVVYGGDGDDRINGSLTGVNSWSSYAATGPILAYGDAGDDFISGSDGDDTLLGGIDNDFLVGNSGNDSMDGESGNDTLIGLTGDDTLFGGAGADSLQGGTDADLLLGGADNDTLFGGFGDDTLLGEGGHDTLYGNENNDSLAGGDGDDDLFGADGNDTLVGQAGFDKLQGGAGNDTYILQGDQFLIFDYQGANQIIVERDFVKVPYGIDATPTYAAGVMALPYWLDSLLGDDANSNRALLGGSTTFYFGFPGSVPGYYTDPAYSDGWLAYNDDQKDFARDALTYVATIVNLAFVETTTLDANNVMSFANNNQTGTAGYATYPNATAMGSDVFLDKNTAGNLAPAEGSHSALTLIHEIGHALGLKHPFEGTPQLSAAEDKTEWTVMSYTENAAQYYLQFQPLDIAALHYLYGPSPGLNAGNTTHIISESGPNFVYDGAGTDTVDASAVSQGVTIYLTPGYWGFVGASKASLITGAGQVTVNFGTVIEDLLGSGHADTLVGNAAGNTINGNGGDDTVTGGAGNDTLDGGDGTDTAVYSGNRANYTIIDNGDSFTVTDNVGDEGSDTLTAFENAQFSDQTVGLISNSPPTGTVVITGTPAEGQVLTADTSGIGDADGLGAFAYQWKAGGIAILGAVGESYQLTQNEVGKVITVSASYTDGQGTVESVTSAATTTVTSFNSPPTGSIQVNGLTEQGQTLTLVDTLEDADGLGIVSYQWQADSLPIAGAIGSSYELTQQEVGKAITVTASYQDGGGTVESVTSSPTTPVANVNDAPTGSVMITGQAIEGRILTASNSLADADGIGEVSYQWYADGEAIDEATGNTFELTQDQVGTTITVLASYTDGFGEEESKSSTATAPVLDSKAIIQLSGLDGGNGFRLNGVAENDTSGWSVSGAGDVNGDGLADILIGAPSTSNGDTNAGSAYLVFGSTDEFPASINLSDLNGTNGFRMDGIAWNDKAGISVSGIGDINGDGFDDLAVGSEAGDASELDNTGTVYIVFGKESGFAASQSFAALDGANGFRLDGVSMTDFTGWSVQGAGDINDDGYDDIIVGGYGSDINGPYAGSSYVLFGSASEYSAVFELTSLDGSNGFRFDGNSGDEAGYSVSGAGDINGDGFDDLIIGAIMSKGPGTGAAYVLYGRAGGFAATVTPASLDGNIGSRLNGESIEDWAGISVSGAGDVNGDGLDDLIIGAYWADPHGQASGSSYVVFGSAEGLPAQLELASLDGTNGYRLDGVAAIDQAGISVSGAGDLNGDGFDDIIIGANGADPNGEISGAAYVVYGKADGYDAIFSLAALNGFNGFRVDGVGPEHFTGQAVSGLGDVNGDGFDDVIIGAYGASPNVARSGASYVVFGIGNRAPEGEVTIYGLAKAGEILTVRNTLSDEDGLGEISYQWYADGVSIDGAGGDSYELTSEEVGKVITVIASYIDDGDASESVESPATEIVQAAGLLKEGGPFADVLEGGLGNDTLSGFGGNDTLLGFAGDDELLGGDGTDHAVFESQRADYVIVNNLNQLEILGPAADGNDTLFAVERLHFTDVSLAFDLDGSAGQSVRLLGTVLGAAGAADLALRGIGIDIFDNAGLSFEQVMDVALDVVLQPNRSNEAVVNLLWANLVGGPTPQDLFNDLVGALEGEVFTQVDLAVVASGLLDEVGVIDSGQLTLVGVDYQPVG